MRENVIESHSCSLHGECCHGCSVSVREVLWQLHMAKPCPAKRDQLDPLLSRVRPVLHPQVLIICLEGFVCMRGYM